MLDYNKKYLKYKSKYNNLKKNRQAGGHWNWIREIGHENQNSWKYVYGSLNRQPPVLQNPHRAGNKLFDIIISIAKEYLEIRKNPNTPPQDGHFSNNNVGSYLLSGLDNNDRHYPHPEHYHLYNSQINRETNIRPNSVWQDRAGLDAMYLTEDQIKLITITAVRMALVLDYYWVEYRRTRLQRLFLYLKKAKREYSNINEAHRQIGDNFFSGAINLAENPIGDNIEQKIANQLSRLNDDYDRIRQINPDGPHNLCQYLLNNDDFKTLLEQQRINGQELITRSRLLFDKEYELPQYMTVAQGRWYERWVYPDTRSSLWNNYEYNSDEHRYVNFNYDKAWLFGYWSLSNPTPADLNQVGLPPLRLQYTPF